MKNHQVDHIWRFNGAAPLWARRCCPVGVPGIRCQELQWGRAFVGAEIPKLLRRERPPHELQWGRAFVGAEMKWANVPMKLAYALQWGRAFVGAEIPRGFRYWSKQYKLQWGRAFVGAEIVAGHTGFCGGTRASMGPRLCGRGDLQV